jgi:S-adenosylmethionine synthetase
LELAPGRRLMLRILGLSLLYFVLVFGAGFVLGPIRVLLLEPHLGRRVAELLEMPIMLLVIWAAASWLTQRFTQNLPTQEQLSIGTLAVMGVLAADVAVGVFLREMTIAEVFLHRDTVLSVAYYGLLVLCALMPWLQARPSQQHIG